MNKTALHIVVVFIVCAVCAPLWAQGTFDLTQENVGHSQDPLVQMAARRVRVVATDSSGMSDLPGGVSDKVSRFTVPIAGRDAPFLLDFGPDPLDLYADTDADGRLADEQPMTLKKIEQTTDPNVPSSRASVETVAIEYRTFSMRAPGRSRGAMLTLGLDGWVQGRQQAFLSIYPGARVSGTVTLGGKPLRVALMDATLDGRYDTFLTSAALGDPLSCDAIAIDLDQDGQFHPSAQGAEVLQLSRTMRVSNGYYDFRPARDGSTVRVTTARPRFGTLDVGCPDLSLMLVSETGTYQLSGNGGKWELPVGAYRLQGLELRTTNDDGTVWLVYGNGTQGGALSQFEIRKGRTTTILAGPPLTLASTTTARGDAILINLDVYGRAGERYRAGAYKGEALQPAPTFVVVDRSGAELASGAFSYG